MSGLGTFDPDSDYCAYCHAPAAGLCARCHALCCPACVELEMGWTQRQAVCVSCLEKDPPVDASSRTWPIAVAAALLCAAGAWLLLTD